MRRPLPANRAPDRIGFDGNSNNRDLKADMPRLTDNTVRADS